MALIGTIKMAIETNNWMSKPIKTSLKVFLIHTTGKKKDLPMQCTFQSESGGLWSF